MAHPGHGSANLGANLRLVISVAVSCCIVFATIFFGLDYLRDDPSTEVLDADIATVENRISEAEAEAASFGTGAIAALVQVRLQTLKATLDMLDQKRRAIIRRVDMQYLVDGVRRKPDPDAIAALESELAGVQAERDRHQREADRYSGGLIQTISLMSVATSEVTMAQINLSLLAERYGFLFSMPPPAPAEPVGQTIVENDGDAL